KLVLRVFDHQSWHSSWRPARHWALIGLRARAAVPAAAAAREMRAEVSSRLRALLLQSILGRTRPTDTSLLALPPKRGGPQSTPDVNWKGRRHQPTASTITTRTAIGVS